jgi:hypothetical protein
MSQDVASATEAKRASAEDDGCRFRKLYSSVSMV